MIVNMIAEFFCLVSAISLLCTCLMTLCVCYYLIMSVTSYEGYINEASPYARNAFVFLLVAFFSGLIASFLSSEIFTDDQLLGTSIIVIVIEAVLFWMWKGHDLISHGYGWLTSHKGLSKEASAYYEDYERKVKEIVNVFSEQYRKKEAMESAICPEKNGESKVTQPFTGEYFERLSTFAQHLRKMQDNETAEILSGIKKEAEEICMFTKENLGTCGCDLDYYLSLACQQTQTYVDIVSSYSDMNGLSESEETICNQIRNALRNILSVLDKAYADMREKRADSIREGLEYDDIVFHQKVLQDGLSDADPYWREMQIPDVGR